MDDKSNPAEAGDKKVKGQEQQGQDDPIDRPRPFAACRDVIPSRFVHSVFYVPIHCTV